MAAPMMPPLEKLREMVDRVTTAPRTSIYVHPRPGPSSIRLTALAATGPPAARTTHDLQIRLVGRRTENSRKLAEVLARRARAAGKPGRNEGRGID